MMVDGRPEGTPVDHLLLFPGEKIETKRKEVSCLALYSMENIVNNYVIPLYADIPKLYLCGDHFEMYRNMESLGCIAGIDIF